MIAWRLKHHPPSEYFADAKFTASTKRTLTSPAKLMEQLDEVRKKGYAIVDQELEIGLRSISVPVKAKANTVIAAMNVGTQAAARVSIAGLRERIYPDCKRQHAIFPFFYINFSASFIASR